MSSAPVSLEYDPSEALRNRSSSLTIPAWLNRFGSRQARMLAARGMACAVISLFIGAQLLMALDAYAIMSDGVRWALSLVNYGVATWVGSVWGLDRIWRSPDPVALAKQVEFACPELRESLLACTELQALPEGAPNFSREFLHALQQQVVGSLSGIAIQGLLPWQLVRVPIGAAMVGLLLLSGLCFVPSLSMGPRLSRVLLPFLEIPRPTRSKIVILTPARADAKVPEHQLLSFEIQLEGEPAEQAWLEILPLTGTRSGARETIAMERIQSSPPVFVCTAPVGNRPLRYRFLAGDAETSYRRISPLPRPRVSEFRHRIQFPEYVQLPSADITTESGNITVLEGSMVALRIRPSLPLVSAEATIEILDTGERETHPMEYSPSEDVWSTNVEAASDLRYRFALSADAPDAEAPIENTFRPVHEINVVADNPPRAVWIASGKTLWQTTPPPNQTWIVAPEEILSLAVAVADDLPNTRIKQQVAINRGSWTDVPLELPLQAMSPESAASRGQWATWLPLDGVDQPARFHSEWAWDLLTASAVSGDTVSVRVAVEDSRGQVSYSQPVELSLASVGFDRERHQALLLRASLVPELQALADGIRDRRKELEPRLQLLKDPVLDPAQRTAMEKEVAAVIDPWIAQCERIRSLACNIVSKQPRILDQSETEYVVRAVSKLEREFATCLRAGVRASMFESDHDALHPKVLAETQRQLDRGLRAFGEAESTATRMVDIYRQWIGHECLTAMTKDLMYLRDHQQEQLARASQLDFAMLARSQKIADQYMESVSQLSKEMEPFVSQHLRDQFRNLDRFLDQTRTELQALSQLEATPQAFEDLVQRVKRCTEDLRHHHWAFHLDGGLWWNIADLRREAIHRGMGVSQTMQQAIDALIRRQEILNDRTLDSHIAQRLQSLLMEELTMALLPASSQITDRRGFHQHRIPVDPKFASDMGLAMRAWQSVLESWDSMPFGSEASNRALDDLRGIVRAYRVLETAHEMHDMRAAAGALQKQEQFGWQTHEAQLSHLRQWESLNHRFEWVHQGMNDAGFPRPIADQFNAMRWSDMANRIRQKLEPRRNPNNEVLVSASPELQELLAVWDRIDRDAAPTVVAAREFLSRFSPRVSELAERAAQRTRTLQQLSRRVPESEGNLKDLTAQQSEVDRNISQLQDALLELASEQNILDLQQLQLAKDSDHALQWVDKVAPPMLQATQELARLQRDAREPEQVARAAKEADNKQERAARALETIAKHFALLEPSRQSDTPQDPGIAEKSRADMLSQRAAEESEENPEPTSDPGEKSRDRNPLESYFKADQLNDMAQRSPEELLKQLEAALQQSPPMQRELSDLSQANVADSIAQLKNAAKREDGIAKQLENADSDRLASKQEQVQMLKHLADSTERYAVNLLEKSQQAVRRMNLPETRNAIERVASSLQDAVRQARAIEPADAQAELDRKSEGLQDAIQSAQQQLAEVLPRVEERQDQSTSKSDPQRQGQLTEMQSWQSLMRDEMVRRSKEQVKQRQQQAEHLRRESENKNRDAEQKRQQRARALEAHQKQPDAPSAQSRLDQATNEWFTASQRAASAKRVADAAGELARKTEERSQQIENAARANLDHPNPLAALASEQLDKAQQELGQLQADLAGLQQTARQLPEPKSNAPSLKQASSEHQEISDSVRSIAEQLSRSARHEQRLNNEAGSERLTQQSQGVRQASDEEMASTQQELASAEESAKASEAAHAEASRQESNPQPPTPPSSAKAIQSVQQASERLAREATNLEQNVAPKSDSEATASKKQGAQTAPPSSDPSTGNLPQSPKELARLLDQLDQKLRSSMQGEGSGSSQPSPAGSEGEESQSGSGRSEGASGSPSSSDRPTSGQPEGAPSRARSELEEALRESAEQISSQLQSERMANREGTRSRNRPPQPRNAQYGGQPEHGAEVGSGPVGSSRLPSVPKDLGSDWGRLRDQRAEEVTEGRREVLDPEFQEAIRAYYRGLSKQPNG